MVRDRRDTSMPRQAKPLTQVQINNTKPGNAEKRLYDGGGMYLSVMPTGARWWRLKYHYAGKERRIGLGPYPPVGLADARVARDSARRSLREGIDPGRQRREDSAAVNEAAANTFSTVAEEWLARRVGKGNKPVADVTANKNCWLINHAMPALKSRPIADITSREVLDVLRKVESADKLETARRVKIVLGQVFRHAILAGKIETDPTVALAGALKAPQVKHHAAITDPTKVGELLRAIDGFCGQPTTLAALKLAPLVFVRPGELRTAQWVDIDLDRAEWSYFVTKTKVQHIVPLSCQALSILHAVQPLTGHGRYVFPSTRSMQRPMSENTINAALRRLGYTSDEQTGHGFRSIASTLLNESGWAPDAIERQLSHKERDKVRAAYNRAAYMTERRKMMQSWANCLDSLRKGGNAIPMKQHA